jgi:GTP-binding protein YchF
MLRAGIVGLPNVGKSTLFNALTRTRKAEAANYPFCTIEPNVGVVAVPDERLEPLARIAKSERIVPATIEFVDIAGLVRGASQGEGLGNKFLQHIREVDAIVEVVRCFESRDIVHVSGTLDPIADIETVKTELVLADLETVGRARDKFEKAAKGGEREARAGLAVADRLLAHLNEGKRALTAALSPEEREVARRLFLLT